MQDSDTISRSDDVVSREVGGETVLLDLGQGTYYGLNAVGGRIWEFLEGGDRTIGEIIALLTDEFDVTVADAEADLRALLTELEANALVKRAV
ncbi:PqqD family protein [Aurantiacibacter sp. D1-12]|uniref:PqqD family protein n=1 Tax=Aurantiacibacter sp. D1-12 TaxID=2993658 RepID=UPI00237D2272|nr:PqqD family protein [Aurantiacibacter sp. D1-12]MDE1467448.1 PqqD family protein [Aurantiacibacter sp. D1-12]